MLVYYLLVMGICDVQFRCIGACNFQLNGRPSYALEGFKIHLPNYLNCTPFGYYHYLLLLYYYYYYYHYFID